MEKVYDYIVVGSGFRGSVASLRLSEKVIFCNNHRASIFSLVEIYMDEREEEWDPGKERQVKI